MMRSKQLVILALLAWSLAVGILLSLGILIGFVSHVEAACEPYPVTEHSPTGIVGCELYGEGIASRWGGPGVARNDCVWPWTHCTPIAITSLQTGITIIVTPRMFCDCYTGTADERLVDLGPTEVAALGLDPDQGLYPVSVEPASIVAPEPSCDPACGMLPNTAMTP